MKATLLIELLTEELPPKSLERLGKVFRDEIFDGLIRHQLKHRVPADAQVFATPRRLAVLVRDVEYQAQDRGELKKIMPVKVALDANGQPTPALLKKLEAEGSNVNPLLLVQLPDAKAGVADKKDEVLAMLKKFGYTDIYQSIEIH